MYSIRTTGSVRFEQKGEKVKKGIFCDVPCERFFHCYKWLYLYYRSSWNNRVPVPPHIDIDSIIHGATDNFDHNNCHHTILMLLSVKKNGEEHSEIWKFFDLFTDQIMPILNDLTRSFKESDWLLLLNANRRALPMFFILNRTNYSRWVPIYFEDCCNLEAKFPILHQSFCDGNFVVHHTNRRNCGMPIDQALKKEYHKKAKGPGGIIGITRKEGSVAKFFL